MRKTSRLFIAVGMLLIAGLAWGQGMHGQQGQQNRMSGNMMGMNAQQGRHGMTGNGMQGMGMMSMMHGGMMGAGMMGGTGMMSGQVPSVFTILRQTGALGLTADQTDALQKGSLELQKTLIQLRSRAAVTSLDISEAFDTGNPDQQDIQKLLQKRIDTLAEMQKQLVSSYFQGLTELNENQRAQLTTAGSGCMMMAGGNTPGDSPLRGMMGQ